MKSAPLFSILMANYNNSHFIEEAIRSVVNQSYQHFEIILVDDHSNDESDEIIQEMVKSESRIKYFRNKKNLGYGASLKKAVKYSEGELVGILDPDDALTPNALAVMVKAFQEKSEASMIYSTLFLCDENLKINEINPSIGPLPDEETYLTFKHNYTSHISHFRVFQRRFYDLTEGYDKNFKRAVDKDIIYKLEEVGPVYYVDEPLYFYRQHSGSISLFRNTLKAKLWAIKAMSMAYDRRKKLLVKNITLKDIRREYAGTFKMLAKESLINKKYFSFIYHTAMISYYEKSVVAGVKYGYYCLLKFSKPDLFQSN